MAEDLIEESIITRGTCWVLPRRTGLGCGGVAILVMGLAMIIWFAPGIWLVIWHLFTSPREVEDWFKLVFALFQVPFVLIGLALTLVGLGMVGGSRCVVELTDDKLVARERLGPFSLAWHRPRDLVTGIRPVRQQGLGGNDKQFRWEWLLAVTGPQIRDLRFARGYGQAIVEDLARRLGVALRIAVAPLEVTRIEPPQVVAAKAAARVRGAEAMGINAWDATAAEASDAGPPPQPADGRVVHEVDPRRGLAARVPALGLRKGSKGLFVFSLAWNGFIAVFVTILVWAMIHGDTTGETPPPLAMLFMVPFVAIGIGTMLAAINLARRRVELMFTPTELCIKRTGIFGTRVIEVPTRDITAIDIGPSGTTINGVAMMELQIERRVGHRVNLLSQLDDAEIVWLAMLMNHLRAQWERQD